MSTEGTVAEPQLFLSEEERQQLLNDPTAFTARVEQLVSSLAQKVRGLEAARAAEQIDAEQLQHELERTHVTLRAERDRAKDGLESISASHSELQAAHAALVADAQRCHEDLRSRDEALQRAKTVELEAEDERRRLLETVERKASYASDLERELTNMRQQLRSAQEAAKQTASTMAGKQTEWVEASMQLTSLHSQIELEKKRREEADTQYEALLKELSELRKSKAEALSDLGAKNASLAKEKTELDLKVQEGARREEALRVEGDRLRKEATESAKAAAADAQHAQLKLHETERLVELYRTSAEQEKSRAEQSHRALEEAIKNHDAFKVQQSEAAAESTLTIQSLQEAVAAAEAAAERARLAAPKEQDGFEADVEATHERLLQLTDQSGPVLSLVDASSLSRTELYSHYREAREQLGEKEKERERMATMLQSVMDELDAKAPRILEQRKRFEELSEAHEQMAQRLQVSMQEAEHMASRVQQLEGRLVDRDRQVMSLDQEVSDKEQQLQRVLFEAQRLAAADEVLRKGALGSSPGPTLGSRFGTPSAARAVTSSPSTPQAVISKHLVEFKDVVELQQQNAKLLKVVRRLGEDHEKELVAREEEARAQLEAALVEVEQIKQESDRQRELVEMLTQQRDMYKAIRSPHGPDADSSGTATKSAQASTEAASVEVASLREELAQLRELSSTTEKELSEQLERARDAERQASIKSAQAEAQVAFLQAKVAAQEQRMAAERDESVSSRSAEAAMSSQLLALQQELKARTDEYQHALQASKRNARLLELSTEEKSLLEQSESRLRAELQQQAQAQTQLRELLQRMQEMQGEWKRTEADSAKQLQTENERLHGDWVEAKAALLRERERCVELGREAEVKAAAHSKQLQEAEAAQAAAKEQIAALEARVRTLEQLHETAQLQLREAAERRPRAEASDAESRGAVGLAEELASVRRELGQAQLALEAEKGHARQYEKIAAAAEKERDEQLRLSAEYKQEVEAQIKSIEAARDTAEEGRRSAQRSEGAQREAVEALRRELRDAAHAAQKAKEEMQAAIVARDAAAAQHNADKKALEVQLASAKEAEERSAAKYRTELLNHSQDMQLLSKAKEDQARAELTAEQAETKAAQSLAELEACTASYESRSAALSSQLAALEEQHASSLKEVELLHAQLSQLSSSAASSGGSGASESEAALELVRRLRSDKETLQKRNELLTIDARRLEQQNEALDRQKRQLQERVTELQEAAAESRAGEAHALRMEELRELNLLRDSNALMRQREDQKAAELRRAQNEAKAMREQVEPLQRARSMKEAEVQALNAQIEQMNKEAKSLQERLRKFLSEDRNTVALEQFEQLQAEKAELKKQLDAARTEAASLRQQLSKIEAELASEKQMTGRLRATGGKFKQQAEDLEKRLEEERSAKTQLEGQVRTAEAEVQAAREEDARLNEQNAQLTARLQEMESGDESNAKKLLTLQVENKTLQEQSKKFLYGFRTSKETLAAKIKENEQLREQLRLATEGGSADADAALIPPSAPPAASQAGRGRGSPALSRAARRGRAAGSASATVASAAADATAEAPAAEGAEPGAEGAAEAAGAPDDGGFEQVEETEPSERAALGVEPEATPLGGAGTRGASADSLTDVAGEGDAAAEGLAGSKRTTNPSAAASPTDVPASKKQRASDSSAAPGSDELLAEAPEAAEEGSTLASVLEEPIDELVDDLED